MSGPPPRRPPLFLRGDSGIALTPCSSLVGKALRQREPSRHTDTTVANPEYDIYAGGLGDAMDVLLCIVLYVRVFHNVRLFMGIIGSWHTKAQQPNPPEPKGRWRRLLFLVEFKRRVKEVEATGTKPA